MLFFVIMNTLFVFAILCFICSMHEKLEEIVYSLNEIDEQEVCR